MADQDQDKGLEVFKAIVAACDVLPTFDERLMVLGMAWLSVAETAREDALSFPGGYPAERAKHEDWLEKMLSLVREATPDIEAERLYRENDAAGYVAHCLRKLQDNQKDGE